MRNENVNNPKNKQSCQTDVSGSVTDTEYDYLCGKCHDFGTNNLDDLFDHRQLCKLKINKIKKLWNQLMQMLFV